MEMVKAAGDDNCNEIRENLLALFPGNLYLLSLVYFSKRHWPIEKQLQLEKISSHISTCNGCKIWFKNIVTPKLYKRQSRRSKYCCEELFRSVEENACNGEVHIHPISFRGEIVWSLQQLNPNATICILSYCPWCGAELPSEPYVPDRKGFGLTNR